MRIWTYKDSFNLEIHEELEVFGYIKLTAMVSGRFAGKVSIGVFDSDFRSLTLDVLDYYKGRGIAQKLMYLVTQVAREKNWERLELRVERDNAVARHIYEKLGWRHVKPEKGGDLLYYELKLGPG